MYSFHLLETHRHRHCMLRLFLFQHIQGQQLGTIHIGGHCQINNGGEGTDRRATLSSSWHDRSPKYIMTSSRYPRFISFLSRLKEKSLLPPFCMACCSKNDPTMHSKDTLWSVIMTDGNSQSSRTVCMKARPVLCDGKTEKLFWRAHRKQEGSLPFTKLNTVPIVRRVPYEANQQDFSEKARAHMHAPQPRRPPTPKHLEASKTKTTTKTTKCHFRHFLAYLSFFIISFLILYL